MIEKSGIFFEVSVMCQMTDGTEQKKTKRVFLIDAVTYTEAESAIMLRMADEGAVEPEVASMNKKKDLSIMISEKDEDDKYWKVKVAIITYDEKTDKQKATNTSYIVNAKTVELSIRYLRDSFSGTTLEYEVMGTQCSNIEDIILHGKGRK